MKYRHQGISPEHTMCVRFTKKEKKILQQLHKKLNAESDCYISMGELVRRAVIAKIEQFNLKNKRLKKKEKRLVKVSVTATEKLNRQIKAAFQESTDKSLSEFMRTAIFEYYKLKV